MSYTVVFTPEAEAQLIQLYGYIAEQASPDIAAGFTDGIVACCENLSTFFWTDKSHEELRHLLTMD
jgi:toxin ParE1/3/4